MSAKPFAIALLAGLLMAGCANLEPKYQRPAPPVPAAWPSGEAYTPPAPAGTPAADLGWRSFFTDPKLRAVIELATAENRDLRVALINIQAARAQYITQRAARLPTLNGVASATIEQEPAAVFGVPSTAEERIHTYSAGLGVSDYELDLWGRVKSLTKASFEQYLATAEGRTRRAHQHRGRDRRRLFDPGGRHRTAGPGQERPRPGSGEPRHH